MALKLQDIFLESKIIFRFTNYFYIPGMKIFSYLSTSRVGEGITYDFNRVRGQRTKGIYTSSDFFCIILFENIFNCMCVVALNNNF